MDTRTQPNQTNASVVANALPQPQVPYDNANVTPARLPRTPPGFEGMISGHGLRIRFCVWMPDLPRQDNPVTHRDARPRLGSGFDTEAHGIDLLGHARQFGLGWREFQDYAVRLFRTQHPAAGLQIQAVRDGGTGSIRWQGMIHHHPRYGIYSNAIIDSESSWRAFALAIGHAATVGQDSQIWCVAGGEPEPHAPLDTPTQRQNRPQVHRSPSAEITFMYPYYTPEEIAGGQMVSPDIIVMVPSPTTLIPYPTIGLPLPNPHEHTAIGLEDFLAISGIGQEDMKTRRLIICRTITHWSYFRSTNEQQLRALGFDEDAAHVRMKPRS
ncbi:hypothetical protein PCANC_02046 [Puccinia coronata f. sp. avenae]|uniref:Uncharacterized protein n=1 Tax=Puccinia coronata f. sp. avenae TaxID=200324 RepID=A0A2N5W1X9_9BASI|nr:hypothetical protein PCANC_02046 [Puccinia coronata f. sp. avenae]